MRNVLYIGNNLSNRHTNLSSIHVLGKLLEEEGYTLRYASSYNNKLFRLLDMLWQCGRLAKRMDVVLIDTYSTHNFYYALLVSQLCRVLQLPYIPSLNGGNLPARLARNPKLCAMIFKNAHYNVSPSSYLQDAFAKQGYDNVVHIPNSIKLEEYPVSKRRYDTIRLLWVRSFSKIYNPQLAVNVLKRLKQKGYDASLCMVGPDSDGSLESVKLLAKDLNLDVRFTGKLTKMEWTQLAKEYNVFINTTNFDNTPVSVIEAMALGLPIVSTDVGGMPYLINHGVSGLLVPPNDVYAMVGAIEQVYGHSTLREDLVRNARTVVAEFDWEMVKQRWNAVLQP
ncbi:glycosyltransferase family 4 protein [Mangrovimonas sp. YM274]|uniref:glycosyltransferase family 4 protein n=1 Tax=Mangrovimonas sp. YM274 TaxID=3070660 RepID=UPI0027DE773A|nr:glycosyltransferase family 4 protein [Mangrovimonas sp. YM274]WMI69865.1 glycosyltransferase family 4 protein [Mangrovimonas sp. YM274]